jgi:multiple sugar transport system substrate-binding protein
MNLLKRTTAVFSLTVLALVTSGGLAGAGEVVWWTPNWGEARAKELVQRFQAANPGITIKMQITVSDGLPQRVLTALQSGGSPDIIEVQHGWVNGYAQAGLVLPLDDTIQNKEDYNAAAINSVIWNGKLWAIPYRMETRAVVYNRGDFVAAGLDPDKPPKTWDELVKAATALTKSGKFGYAITGGGEVGNTLTGSLPFIWMNGGDIVSADLTKATVNQPAAVEAVKFYTDFYKKGLSPTSTLENDGNTNRRLFIANTVSAYYGGQFDLPQIRQQNPRIDIGIMQTPHPAGKQTSGVLGGWSYIVPKDAKNPAEAKKFLQFVNTAENQGFFTDTFPVRASALNLPRFNDPMLANFRAMLPYARPFPVHKNWVQIGQAYFDGIQRILLGDQTVQKAMDQANDEIQALLGM